MSLLRVCKLTEVVEAQMLFVCFDYPYDISSLYDLYISLMFCMALF